MRSAAVGRALRWPLADQALALLAFVLLWVMVAALRILPYRTVEGIVGREGRRRAGSSSLRLAEAVRRASPLAPPALCLARGLAWVILARLFGGEGILRFGVRRGTNGALDAHAWIESKGRIILGEPSPDLRYEQMR
jgi:hypothetical protein